VFGAVREPEGEYEISECRRAGSEGKPSEGMNVAHARVGSQNVSNPAAASAHGAASRKGPVVQAGDG